METPEVESSNLEVADSKAKMLELNPLAVYGNMGQITFSVDTMVFIYFIPETNSGQISIDGTVYNLNTLENDTEKGTYTLKGENLEVVFSVCTFKENEGSDCFYGQCGTLKVRLGNNLIEKSNFQVQDCPSN